MADIKMAAMATRGCFLWWLHIWQCSGSQTVQVYQVSYFYENVKNVNTKPADYLNITELTINYSPEQFMMMYMISMESLTIKT